MKLIEMTFLMGLIVAMVATGYSCNNVKANASESDRPQPSCTFPHPVSAIFCLNGHTGDCHVCKPEHDGSTSCWSVDLYNMCKH